MFLIFLLINLNSTHKQLDSVFDTVGFFDNIVQLPQSCAVFDFDISMIADECFQSKVNVLSVPNPLFFSLFFSEWSRLCRMESTEHNTQHKNHTYTCLFLIGDFYCTHYCLQMQERWQAEEAMTSAIRVVCLVRVGQGLGPVAEGLTYLE